MKIVFLDTNTLGFDLDFSRFSSFGEVRTYGHSTTEEILDRGKDAQILISNKVYYNEEIMKQLPNLKLICLTSTGTNTVDVNKAKELGIRVCNIVGYSTESVVQLTFSMIFYLLAPLAYYDRYVKEGEYVEDYQFKHFHHTWHELYGKTLGIVGFGRIGQRVAQIANAFGAKVIYYSTSGDNHHKEYEEVSFESLLEKSDLISIHAPLNESTKYLFRKEAFCRMKKSAILINLGRGLIVHEEELIEALNQEQITAAALDVLEFEPMKKKHPIENLINKNKLFITPHIAWASIEARNRMLDEVYQNIESYLSGGSRNQVEG